MSREGEANILNAAGMKSGNRKIILEKLRISPVSRAELARQTGLTRSAVGVIAEQLLSEGILKEGENIVGNIGRRSVELRFNPDKYCIAGINIARDCCTVGIADFAGDIRHTAKIQLTREAEVPEILEKIYLTLINILDYNSSGDKLLGIGITSPGPVDSIKGRIINPPNFPKWENLNITAYFEDKFKCPVLLENNAIALALAERYFGIGGRYRSYIELSVDTGVGAGMILDNRLYKGTAGFGSDFGHITVNIDGEQCSCGNHGCVELYSSIPNIVKYAGEKNPLLTSWEIIVKQARSGAEDARGIVEREADYLSAIITSAMNILDVEAIILAGDITCDSDLIIPMLEKRANRQFIGKTVKKVEVVSSGLKLPANILSCINMVLEYFIQTIEI